MKWGTRFCFHKYTPWTQIKGKQGLARSSCRKCGKTREAKIIYKTTIRVVLAVLPNLDEEVVLQKDFVSQELPYAMQENGTITKGGR